MKSVFLSLKRLYRCALAVFALMLTAMSGASAQDYAMSLKASFNASNVLLPASQWTPSQTWTAQTMVFNDGRSYADADYNHVWGTPPDDGDGRRWFEVDYELTGSEPSWQQQRSPFSSDAVYKGQTSCQWITSGVTGDIYLRRTFTLDRTPEADIFLACGHDDAPAEFYINGTLVWSVADGWNNDEYILLTPEQKALLKTDGSENLLAVHVHQNWGGAFADCGLYEADMERQYALLPTLTEGPWLCAYYLLDSNEELAAIPVKDWAGRCADEREWIQGVGPFSSGTDLFHSTSWASTRQALLVRRHFTLTADMLANVQQGTLVMDCSYDENPKVYINGHLLWSASGWNDNSYARCTFTARQKRWLREGDNVLAVSLQRGEGSGHIDIGLSLTEQWSPDGITSLDAKNAHSIASDDNRDLTYRLDGTLVADDAALGKGLYVRGHRTYIVTGK